VSVWVGVAVGTVAVAVCSALVSVWVGVAVGTVAVGTVAVAVCSAAVNVWVVVAVRIVVDVMVAVGSVAVAVCSALVSVRVMDGVSVSCGVSWSVGIDVPAPGHSSALVTPMMSRPSWWFMCACTACWSTVMNTNGLLAEPVA
jgi:hypothetical protein